MPQTRIKPSFLDRTKNILLASVNPQKESVFARSLSDKYKNKVLKIGREIKLKIPILVEIPGKVGIDRLLNAIAAYERTKTSTIVIDVGTAITIDLVSKKGEFLGGLILPGIKMCARALNKQTALLPNVNIKKTAEIIGKNTEDAISAGIYNGTVGAILHILKEIRKRHKDMKYSIITGGDTKILKKDVPLMGKHIPYLTLEGIRIAYTEEGFKT